MQKKTILRICHKYLINNDGYDLDVQDLCKSTSKTYNNYVIAYLNKSSSEYIKDNKLIKKGKFYYHPATKTKIYFIKYKIKSNNYLKDLYKLNKIKIFLKAFKEIYDIIKPDILHVHGTLLYQYLYAAKYAKGKSKVIATHHIGLINQNYIKQNLIILIAKYIIHNLFPLYSNKIVCVSNYGKKSFSLFKKNIVVINPIPLIPKVNISNFNKIIRKNVLNNKFKVTKKDNFFCLIGRICEQKNQLKTIKAFNEIIQLNPNYKLIIIGEIKNQEYYKKLIKEINKKIDNYCIIGNINNKEVIKIIEKSQGLITISNNEGLGRNAMEARLLGKPIIASKNSGYEDFIQNKRNGYLVNQNRSAEIINAIKNIKKLSINNNYSHQDYIKEIKKIYNGK
jgi:glycosyltransferase involved in cell wall biosynthesis